MDIIKKATASVQETIGQELQAKLDLIMASNDEEAKKDIAKAQQDYESNMKEAEKVKDIAKLYDTAVKSAQSHYEFVIKNIIDRNKDVKDTHAGLMSNFYKTGSKR